jgi:hypothetical protein
MSKPLSVQTCRKRLAVLWALVGAVLFIVVVIQSMLGRYGDRVEDAWKWFLPTIMPTLSLIVGVLVIDFKSSEKIVKVTDGFLFWVAFCLSAIYLAIVALTFFIQPFTSVPLLELMNRSNLWLGPLQGLTSASLGAFFVKAESAGAQK